jgi:hypothetical protein
MSKKFTSVDRLIFCLQDHLRFGLTIDARVIEKYGNEARLCHQTEIENAYGIGFEEGDNDPYFGEAPRYTGSTNYYEETFVK